MQVYWKSYERILCELSKSKIFRLYFQVVLPWKPRKRQILPADQNLSSVYFSLAKFQLVSCNLSLAMIWQMTYTRRLPNLCSATLNWYVTEICMPCKRILRFRDLLTRTARSLGSNKKFIPSDWIRFYACYACSIESHAVPSFKTKCFQILVSKPFIEIKTSLELRKSSSAGFGNVTSISRM